MLWSGPGRGEEPGRKYQIVSPRELGTVATGISGRGDVVGFEWVPNKKEPAIIEQVPFFASGKKVTYLPVPAGYTAIFPAAVSEDGTVVGHVGKPGLMDRVVPLRNQAFVWNARTGVQLLGVLADDFVSYACDISADSSRICGFSVGTNRVRACVWEKKDGAWKGSPLPQKSRLSSNRVVMSDDGKRIASIDGEKGCLWTRNDAGQWTEELLGDPGSLAPRSVNNAGTVAGVCYTPDGRVHAVLWSHGQGLKTLDLPQGYVNGEANAVNNAGVVVGMIDGPAGSKIGPDAFVYEAGRLRLLSEGGPYFTSATAINDRGEVAGVLDDDKDAVDGPPANRPRPAAEKP